MLHVISIDIYTETLLTKLTISNQTRVDPMKKKWMGCDKQMTLEADLVKYVNKELILFIDMKE